MKFSSSMTPMIPSEAPANSTAISSTLRTRILVSSSSMKASDIPCSSDSRWLCLTSFSSACFRSVMSTVTPCSLSSLPSASLTGKPLVKIHISDPSALAARSSFWKTAALPPTASFHRLSCLSRSSGRMILSQSSSLETGISPSFMPNREALPPPVISSVSGEYSQTPILARASTLSRRSSL